MLSASSSCGKSSLVESIRSRSSTSFLQSSNRNVASFIQADSVQTGRVQNRCVQTDPIWNKSVQTDTMLSASRFSDTSRLVESIKNRSSTSFLQSTNRIQAVSSTSSVCSGISHE
ncbi:uncharacterized protein LOC144499133 [Mustelus asterias]